MISVEALTNIPQFDHQKKDLRPKPQRREVVGSRAFNLEYFSYTTPEEMYDDIVSYLGEYRFQLKKYDYEMIYSTGKDGKWAMRDTARGESLRIKAKRVLEERRYRGYETHREEGEEFGIKSLDEQLRFAQTGDKLRWMSPPGPASEGYGEYGFLYEGSIDRRIDGTLALHMSAIRLEGELENYNKAFPELTGITTTLDSTDDFLRSPRVVRGDVASLDAEEVLSKNFGFRNDLEQDRDFREAIRRVEPLIHEVIEKIKYGSKTEKVTALNTLENYFLKQKKDIEEDKSSGEKVLFLNNRSVSVAALQGAYGHEAPIAQGSCGSTSQSNSLATTGGKEVATFFGKETKLGDGCSCGANLDNHYHCPKCDERYADETNVSEGSRTKVCANQQCGFKFGC